MNFQSDPSLYQRDTNHFQATPATNAETIPASNPDETNPALNPEPNINTGESLLVPDAVTGTTTDETEFVRIRNFDGEVPTFKMFFHQLADVSVDLFLILYNKGVMYFIHHLGAFGL